MLTRLYANHFRSLVNFEFAVPSLCLLLGPNGSGKSGLGELLVGLRGLVVHGADVESLFSPATFTRWVQSDLQTFEIELSDPESRSSFKYRLSLRHDLERQLVSIDSELLSEGGALLYRFQNGEVELFGDQPTAAARARIAFRGQRSFLSNIEPRKDNTRIVRFRQLVGKISVLKPDPLRMDGRSEREMANLVFDGSNFASWYRHVVVARPEVQESLTLALRELMPGFRHLKFTAFGSALRELTAEFSVSGRAVSFRLHELSDGQRMTVMLYAVLHALEAGDVLFIDEPDNFLALREVRPWLTHLEEPRRAVADHLAWAGGHRPPRGPGRDAAHEADGRSDAV
jgi:energy-coupling factor transporter ATP-binding protein EcfA2